MRHPNWHAEDGVWKATHIYHIISKNNIIVRKLADVGCGSGGVLTELSSLMGKEIAYYGYDISKQAIELARRHGDISFSTEDILSSENSEHFDILLAIDVLEHIPDYMNFLKRCRLKASYKIYHIPLDLSLFSILSDSFIDGRRKLGHVQYFSFQSAIACLKDTDHVIMDYFFTDVGTYYTKQARRLNRTIANYPRQISAFFSVPLSAKIFGRYSIMVLTK
ncbi:MAG TPA: methyltransferase domain-containing protein [Smithellaceae bacterium]|nr:methyltransferase domain-containing protein [Smithellaceae bacterium]